MAANSRITRYSEVVPPRPTYPSTTITSDQRRSGEFRVFSWGTVKEAVAHVKTAQDETTAQTSPGASRSRTVQSGRPEQPFVRKWSAYLRPCHNRVCRLVLLGTTSRLQPNRSLTVQDLSRAEAVRTHDD